MVVGKICETGQSTEKQINGESGQLKMTIWYALDEVRWQDVSELTADKKAMHYRNYKAGQSPTCSPPGIRIVPQSVYFLLTYRPLN